MARTAKKTETEKQIENKGIPSILFIRKINKLGKKFGEPKMFGQQNYNPSSDSYNDEQMEFTGSSIPGAKRNVTPQWDPVKQRWSFEGTFQELSRIASKLKLRDKQTQEVIHPEEDSFYNPDDKFFNHPDLWKSTDLQIIEGNLVLTTSKPLHEFYGRSYLGNPKVMNKLKNQSKSQIAGAEIEIWSPKAEKQMARAEADKNDTVTERLKNMSLETKRAIAMIMKPTGFSELNESEDLLHMELREAALNTQKVRTFGGMTWQNRFLELSEKKDAELHTIANIIDAKMKSVVNRKNSTYYLNGKALYNKDVSGVDINISNEIELIEFFMNPDNDKLYNEMDETLSSIRIQLNEIKQ